MTTIYPGIQIDEGKTFVALAKDGPGVILKVGDFVITMDLAEFCEFADDCAALKTKVKLMETARWEDR